MTFAHLYASARLPLWNRVAWYALDHHDQPLGRGQLLSAVDPHNLIRSAEVIRAIRVGVGRGVLLPGSSTSRLWFNHNDDRDTDSVRILEQDAA